MLYFQQRGIDEIRRRQRQDPRFCGIENRIVQVRPSLQHLEDTRSQVSIVVDVSDQVFAQLVLQLREGAHFELPRKVVLN